MPCKSSTGLRVSAWSDLALPTSCAILWSGKSSKPMKAKMLQIELNTGTEWQSEIDWQKRAEDVVNAALRVFTYGGMADRHFALEFSIKLSDNDEVQQLTEAYLGKDKPTNV